MLVEKLLSKTKYVKRLKERIDVLTKEIKRISWIKNQLDEENERLTKENESMDQELKLTKAAVCYLIDEHQVIFQAKTGENYIFINDEHMKVAMKKKLRIKPGFPSKGLEFRVIK